MTMETVVKSQSFGSAKMQTAKIPAPKQLSKVGQWMRDNPGGIIIVKDRRAVNK